MKWFLSQLTHFRLSIDVLQTLSLWKFAHVAQRRLYLHDLFICSYRWQLKHCFNLQFLSKYSHVRCEYSSNNSFCIKRFVVSALYTFMMSDEYFLSKLIFARFDQITRVIFKFECIDAFWRTMCAIIFCWFCVLIDVILTSWIIISKMRRDKKIVITTFLNNVLFCFNFCFVFIDRVKIFMFSLNKRLIASTSFFYSSIFIILFISFLLNNVLILVFSFFSLIL